MIGKLFCWLLGEHVPRKVLAPSSDVRRYMWSCSRCGAEDIVRLAGPGE